MYNVPWPPQFMTFISSLRLFLVDVISITKANCARPMNYYDSMMVVLVGTKIVLALLVLGPWAWQKFRKSRVTALAQASERRVRDAIDARMTGRRRASVAVAIQRSLASLQQDITGLSTSIDWLKVFRTSFMVLFVSYPGTSDMHVELKSSFHTSTVTHRLGTPLCLSSPSP